MIVYESIDDRAEYVRLIIERLKEQSDGTLKFQRFNFLE